MCGLWGCRFKQPDNRLGTYLAVAGVLMDQRGGHSWGFYADNGLFKDVGLFSTHVRTAGFDGTLFLGHCRYATVGAISKENSHPFQSGSIIGAHNGGVANWKELNDKYGRKFQVDSQHIFEHISLDLPTTEVVAHGAVTYVNTAEEEQTVRLVRLMTGSLYVAQVYEDDDKSSPLGVVWGSTELSVKAGLVSAGFKTFDISEPVWEDIYEARPDGTIVRTDEDLEFASRWDWERENDKKDKKGKKGKSDADVDEWRRGVTNGIKRYPGGSYVNGRWVRADSEYSKSGHSNPPQANRTVTGTTPVDFGEMLEQDRIDWEADPMTRDGRCFGCDVNGLPVKPGGNLGVPLCFDCEAEYEFDPDDMSEQAMANALKASVDKDDAKDDAKQQSLLPAIVNDADRDGGKDNVIPF